MHLHVHTEYSFLDGLIKIKELINTAKENNFRALAITDHGGLFGVFEFYNQCKEAGIKPIIGAELYVAPRGRYIKESRNEDKSYHLTVLVQNDEGYKNLVKLVSLAHIEGFYYKPRVDRELLEKYNRGLIVMSGCYQGEVQKQIILKRDDEAEEAAKWYKEVFGDGYYLEVMRFGAKEEKLVESKLNKLARKYKIKRVATADVHYLQKKHAIIQEILWAIAEGKKLTDPDRRRINSDQFYLKTTDEMYNLWADDIEPVENSNEIAEKCNFELKSKELILPKVEIPKEYNGDYDRFLKDKTYKEGEKRLGRKFNEEERNRVEYELDVIRKKKLAPYFIMCADFARWARENEIFVNTRGSAAGSLVAFALGIVNAHPLKFQLMFERFLYYERPTPPDIDFDFEARKRDNVIKYAIDKYGHDSVAHIITYDRMRTRAVIRDVGRVLGIPLPIINSVAKITPQSGQGTRQITLKSAIEKVPELKKVISESPELTKLYEYANVIDGIARHRGLHACGILITPGKVHDHLPVVVDGETGRLVTQYDMRALEALGFVKMDFLGVENLDVIQDTVKLIKMERGTTIDVQKMIDNFDFNDPKTYELINRLDTLGVFQLESEVMKKTLKIIQPQNIFDVGAALALVRPGPDKEAYGRRRAGKEKPVYLDPRMKKFLQRSYGVLVYQEDLMKCVMELAGMTPAEADKFRKFTGKKIPEILLEQKDDLIKRFKANGVKEEVAEKLIELFLPFADYAFNEAHAASYSIITYLTAYLKAHYPVEFMASLYKAHLQDQEKLGKITEECRKKGIKILPPDINKSFEDFTIEDKKNIRFGMGGIKNVGTKVVKHIIAARGNRPFTSLDDLCSRIELSKVPKSAIEMLIKVGALDSFGKRAALLEALPIVVEKQQKLSQFRRVGQYGLFDQVDTQGLPTKKKEPEQVTQLPDVEEVSDKQKMEWEKELLGTYTTAHPFARLSNFLARIGVSSISTTKKTKVSSKVVTAGTIERVKIVYTKKDQKPMAFITIQDHQNEIDVTIFPSLYEKKAQNLLIEGRNVIISGKLDIRNGELGLIADDIIEIDENKLQKKFFPGKSFPVKHGKKDCPFLKVVLPPGISIKQMKILNKLFLENPGIQTVTVVIPNSNGNREVTLNNKVNFNISLEKKVATLIPAAKIIKLKT